MDENKKIVDDLINKLNLAKDYILQNLENIEFATCFDDVVKDGKLTYYIGFENGKDIHFETKIIGSITFMDFSECKNVDEKLIQDIIQDSEKNRGDNFGK
jgi:predicted transcriptional regulator YdeE